MKQEINELSFCPDVTGKRDPLVSDPTRQRNKNRAGGDVRCWRGQSSPTASLPAVTSSPRDPHDIAPRLVYLVGTLDEATRGGGAHGGTARRDDSGTPVMTLAAQIQPQTSIPELQGT